MGDLNDDVDRFCGKGEVRVKLNNGGLADGRYTDSDGNVWSVTRLIEHSKSLPVFEIPVAGIFIGSNVFKESRSARAIAEHVKRVQETDLRHPIMLDPDGFIMDGWHRVIKALVEGRETIKAVRFEQMPYCDFTEQQS
jgi:hypothetical protein